MKVTPFHTKLGRLVNFKKGSFLGRSALKKISDSGPDCLLCTFTLKVNAFVNGGEAILYKDRVLGITSSGDFGHSVGKPIVMGYIPSQDIKHEDYHIEVYGEPIQAIRHDVAVYDPEGRRFRA